MVLKTNSSEAKAPYFGLLNVAAEAATYKPKLHEEGVAPPAPKPFSSSRDCQMLRSAHEKIARPG